MTYTLFIKIGEIREERINRNFDVIIDNVVIFQ